PFRFHREAGAGCAVEEVGLHIDRPGLAAAQHSFAGFDAHAQTLRHEIFDRPADVARRLLLAVDEQARAPDAARRGAVEIDVLGDGAGGFRFGHADAAPFGAVRAIDDER